MKLNYRPIGDYIQKVDVRNADLKVTKLLGLSMTKDFRETTSNIVGTDMSTYKIMSKYQFACDFMSPIRVSKLPVVLKLDEEPNLVSPAYPVFEIKDHDQLNPEYLMMWFRRDEFDRFVTFKCDAAIRGGYDWDELCNTLIPVPDIRQQIEIVKEFNVVKNCISLNREIVLRLEETASALYKKWFIDCNGHEGANQIIDAKINNSELFRGWRLGNIGEYANVKSGFAFKSEWWKKEGLPVIKIGSIDNNTINPSSLDYVSPDKLEIAKSNKVQAGDIVIAMTGATIGKFGLIPELSPLFLVNQRVGMFNLGEMPIQRAPFLYLTLKSDFVQNEIRNVGGDSAQANISGSQIEEIKVNMPPDDIIEEFNLLCQPIFKLMLAKIREGYIFKDMEKLLLTKLSTAQI